MYGIKLLSTRPGKAPEKVYYSKRKDVMRFPRPPEGGRFLYYNIHLPGKGGKPGTPIGVVALLYNEDLDFVTRGVSVRSLADEWDPIEGRIRAAGRALRAYRKYHEGEPPFEKVSGRFKHADAALAVSLNGLHYTKYVAPAAITPREFRLLEKKAKVGLNSDLVEKHGGSSGSVGM